MNTRTTAIAASQAVYKTAQHANPLSPNLFCADPTAVEYEGRLYVYATNDTEQAEHSDKNDYIHIKSFVVFSTEDMANWVYHGQIRVDAVAPWITNAWAPSIVSRVEKDGRTHFYLYFSNNGNGIGVLTAVHPLGPWHDPLGRPLVWQNMPGLENCPAPFDPGVCIDANGTGWLAFGGGVPATGAGVHTFVPKIVQLGEDLLSFASGIVPIDAPHFYEASELNCIGGTYFYSYSTDLQERGEGWDYEGIQPPPVCSMAYLTTRTPLDSKSWVYRGAFFYNSGENACGMSGLRWGNNHTHFCEFQGKTYILHHTLLLEELMEGTAGFRSVMVDALSVDKAAGDIPITAATEKGVPQTKPLDPYTEHPGTEMCTCAAVGFAEDGECAAKSLEPGAWICVKGAESFSGTSAWTAKLKGSGTIEVRLDDPGSEPVTRLTFDCKEDTWVCSSFFASDGETHDIYLVFSDADILLYAWRFTQGEDGLQTKEELILIFHQTIEIV